MSELSTDEADEESDRSGGLGFVLVGSKLMVKVSCKFPTMGGPDR